MNNVLPFFYWVGGHWSFLYESTEVCYILKTLVRYSFKHEKKTEKDKNLLSNVSPQMFIAIHVIKILKISFQNILKEILCFLPLTFSGRWLSPCGSQRHPVGMETGEGDALSELSVCPVGTRSLNIQKTRWV